MTQASNEQTAAAQIASELGQPTRGKGVDRLAAALAGHTRGPIEMLSDLTDQDRDSILDAFEREHRVGRTEPKYLYSVVELILARKVAECVGLLESMHRATLDRIGSCITPSPVHTDDGSGLGLVDPFDGVTPADGGGM